MLENIFKDAEKEMLDLNHPYVGSEHLLLSLLKDKDISNICNSFDLTYDNFKEYIISYIGKSNIKSKYILYTPIVRNVEKIGFTNIFSLFRYLLENDDCIGINLIKNMNIDIDKLKLEFDKYL